jgi:hypothetical protein
MMHLALATLAGFVTYFVLGGVFFGVLPAMRAEFAKYPAVYRSADAIKKVMPAGMLAMLVAIGALAVLYDRFYRGGPCLIAGAEFGALVGVFAVGSFVIHNHVNLNIGGKLTLQQSIAYFIEWVATGVAIGMVHGG